MRSLYFNLPLYCQPSLNEWRRWHWARRSKHQKAVAEEVFVAVRTAIGFTAGVPMQKVVVTATFHFPSKARRDPSNYSLKFVADALVTNGVLTDDDFNHCEEVVRMGDVAKPGYIEIVVREAME